MEEIENENKMLRNQMKEHQERVDKIPGAPKLFTKWDAGRFVEQPYSDEAAPYAIPKTFKIPPYLKIYDGTMDPEDHVTHYVTAVKGNDLAKEQVSSILLKKFGETLTEGALTWYSQLPACSIETFEEMADKFVTTHAWAKKAEPRVNDIFAIKQSPGEGLRDFLARFNHVRMTLPNISEGMAVAAFQNGLSRSGSRATRKLLSRLMKYLPTTWDEIHNAYCAGVRADEDDLNGPTQRLNSLQMESKKDRKNNNMRDLAGPRPNRERHQPYVKALSCRLHAMTKAHPGHEQEPTEVREVVNMLHQGHLKELMSDRGRANFARGREHHQGPSKPPSPTRTIQMIIRGGDDASINSVKFTTTHKLKRSITHERYDELEESIIFDKSDTHGLVFPHCDALVITLRILDTVVKRIMVDDGSDACIIHPRVLAQMRLENRIVSRYITLAGFNNAVERTSGEITLPVLAGGVTLETTFHIMDQDTAYNAIKVDLGYTP
ncbi:PREDICTED: uncharacterized protein LOC109245017 [Nicotiana attenuata]|uniref:uncharacterized protein LOC109245017 n=1 Tax=Nicotiana attenuata TaxID=49451 RepID=UPI00090554E1|nr:PREDICTED: uncharacterized protein LOC109245017 [Nicotiana attenuata]